MHKAGFRKLPKKEQDRYLANVRELTALAYNHAVRICFAPKLVTFAVELGEGKVARVTACPRVGSGAAPTANRSQARL